MVGGFDVEVGGEFCFRFSEEEEALEAGTVVRFEEGDDLMGRIDGGEIVAIGGPGEGGERAMGFGKCGGKC